jgi:hypothetical protein
LFVVLEIFVPNNHNFLTQNDLQGWPCDKQESFIFVFA